MMNNNRFADIFVEHEYYKGRCSSFYFVPFKSTIDEVKRQDLMIRESEGSLRILSQSEPDEESYELYFGAYTKDAALWNVTEFENSGAKGIPLFDVEKKSFSPKNEPLDKIDTELVTFGLMFVVKLKKSDMKAIMEPVNIPLKTKRCRWQYCIKGDFRQYDVKIRAISDGDENLFDVEKKADNFVVWTSKDEFPIVYGDSPKFQLRTKDTSRVLMKSLPNMNSMSLLRNEVEGGGYEIVAESFINL